jgi:hypothetical protein
MTDDGKRNVKAIKAYFESGPRGREVEIPELKALTPDEREELDAACKKELGWGE